MVTIRLSALNRKLFRDLMGMKGQALSIALVVAAGVAMYVMYQATFASLSETRRVYYERHRFGDVFASLKRAPQRVATEIAAIPGVSALETRVVSSVTLDLPDTRRARGRAAGLDSVGPPAAGQRPVPASRPMD